MSAMPPPPATRARPAAPWRRAASAGPTAGARAALLALAGSAGLAGCAQDGPPRAAGTPAAGSATAAAPAAIARATPPAAGTPQARLLARTAAPPDRRLLLLQLADTPACKGPQLLGQGSATQPPAPMALAAGQWVTLDVVLQDPAAKSACVTRLSFTPQPGRTYLAQSTQGPQGCPALVLDVTVADRAVPPADLLLRSGPGQPCLPLERSGRLAESGLRGGQHLGDAVLRPGATTRGLEGLLPK